MPQQLSPGIVSTERTPDVLPIEAVATDVGALIGVCAQGPISVPTLITSEAQFVRIFGGPISTSYMYESVKGFFQNGGARLYVVRTGHYTTITNPASLDAVKATLQLQNSGPTNTLLVSMVWHGVRGNNYSVQVIRRDTTITTTAAVIPDSAVTTATLTSTARVSVGDQLFITDATPNAIRVFVTAINGNIISFASQNPSGTGTIDSGSNVVLETFDLVFYHNGQEFVRYTDLRMSSLAGARYVVNVVTRADDPEYFFAVTNDNVTPDGTIDPRPVTLAATALGGTTAGSDGSTVVDADVVGDATALNGFYAFAQKRINIMAAPGWTSATVMVGLETYIRTRKYTMALINPPINTTVSGAVTWLGTTVNVSDDQMACYYPWVKIFDPSTGVPITVPPVGLVMGRYANASRTESTAKSPAGIDRGKLVGVVGVEREISTADYDTLYPVRINAILKKPQGLCVFGDKTLGTLAKSLRFVNRRRTHNLVIQSVEEQTEWVLFENNDDETRALFRKTVGAFLLGLWRSKVIDGRKAADAFYVICDGSNNYALIVNQGKFLAQIGIRHKKSINFAEYGYEQDTRAELAELAAAGL